MFTRRMTAMDMGMVIDLARAFHVESPLHSPFPFSAAQVEVLLEGALASPDWLALLCIEKDELVGMSLTYVMPMFFSPTPESGDLTFYVAPQWRGSRAALLLLKEILEWSEAKGARRFTMGVHTGINHAGTVKFLSRMRFCQSGTMMAYELG